MKTTITRENASPTRSSQPFFSPRPQPLIQAKLTINKAGDQYEQEADAMADRVMQMNSPVGNGQGQAQTQGLPAVSIQRKCADCEQKDALQRQKTEGDGQIQAAPLIRKSSEGNGHTATPHLADQLSSSKGGGDPLPMPTLSFMNQAFGADFSTVRVHTDTQASDMSEGIQAKAFTHGQDIYFNEGQYSPETGEGKRLLGHELTHVLQQDTQLGNNQMIQKEEAEEGEDYVPTAEELAEDKKRSIKLQEMINTRYWDVVMRIAKPQTKNHTAQRKSWLEQLDALTPALAKQVEVEGQASFWEVAALKDKIDRIDANIDAENDRANDFWADVDKKYFIEFARLNDIGDYHSEVAAEILKKNYDRLDKLVVELAQSDAMVREDIFQLDNYISTDQHLKSAQVIVDKEIREGEKTLEEHSQEEVVEEPGLISTVWSVVGCDSLAECAGDVALTALTAGAGKVIKAGAKAVKTAKRVKKTRKIVKSAAVLAKKLPKALEKAKSLNKFYDIMKDAVVDALKTYGTWLKKDWKKIASKISTDLIANHTTGEQRGATTVTARRINKEFIASFVENELGIPKANPRYIQVALAVLLKKKYKTAAGLARTFFLQSLKYRTIVNTTFETIQAGTSLTQSDEIVKRTFISTIGECAQDTVQAIPFVENSGLAKYITETARKMVQQIFG